MNNNIPTTRDLPALTALSDYNKYSGGYDSKACLKSTMDLYHSLFDDDQIFFIKDKKQTTTTSSKIAPAGEQHYSSSFHYDYSNYFCDSPSFKNESPDAWSTSCSASASASASTSSSSSSSSSFWSGNHNTNNNHDSCHHNDHDFEDPPLQHDIFHLQQTRMQEMSATLRTTSLSTSSYNDYHHGLSTSSYNDYRHESSREQNIDSSTHHSDEDTSSIITRSPNKVIGDTNAEGHNARSHHSSSTLKRKQMDVYPCDHGRSTITISSTITPIASQCVNGQRDEDEQQQRLCRSGENTKNKRQKGIGGLFH